MAHNTQHNNNANKKLSINQLKILQINVNSIITNERRATLLDYLSKQKPDIALLSETKLNPNHKINFKDYIILRSNRPHAKQGGGTGILIRKDFSFKPIQPNSIKSNKCLETTIIEINLQNNYKLYIIAAYATCNYKKEFIPELKHLFEELHLNNTKNFYLLAGDLNAKHQTWGNTNINKRGISLHKWHTDY
ncbi:RNA-directed DNA polymerase from mobile element jockey [Habropoda laboriosa]|uniref:RNA-directed DNA polymerase from mobile element jockey n=1 Tax=Habropoda laboriosa TaxID=597456 RepID=A0A0L7QY94_9HYME|nr:RNA-directed DNA polymerase from mobile element jockey [Habropoda laboriosa]